MKIITRTSKDPYESDRYIITDDNGQLIDDAQGYGYKTYQKASKAMWYKFKGGQEKIETKKLKMEKFFKDHPGLKNYIYRIYENNFKEIARGEVTNKDILDDIKQKFNINMPEEYLMY